MKLNEGLRPGDLSNLVLPLISVDEYESKIDDKAIVFGFYVQDKNAAADLNKFIQKSSISLLDTEVSPAPDQHGYYLLFVEMMNNDRISENISAILKELEPLVEIDEWQIRIRKTDGILDFSEETLKKALKRAQRTDEAILNYFRDSMLDTVEIDEDILTIGRSGKTMSFEINDFGNNQMVLEKNNLIESSIDFSINTISKCNSINNLLGNGWNISKIKDKFIFENRDESMFLLVTPL